MDIDRHKKRKHVNLGSAQMLISPHYYDGSRSIDWNDIFTTDNIHLFEYHRNRYLKVYMTFDDDCDGKVKSTVQIVGERFETDKEVDQRIADQEKFQQRMDKNRAISTEKLRKEREQAELEEYKRLDAKYGDAE